MFLLNGLKAGDVFFFVACAVVVAAVVGLYFLIPVLKRKQLEEAREALRTREKLFRASRDPEFRKQLEAEEAALQEAIAAEAAAEETPTEESTPEETPEEEESVAEDETNSEDL